MAEKVPLGVSHRKANEEYARPEEVRAILEACESLTIHWRRNIMWKTFYLALWCTGLRVSELLAVRTADVSQETLAVHRGKGGGDDTVPVPAVLAQQLGLYRLACRPGKLLFPVTRQGAHQMLAKACQRAGVRPLHCHLLRHGFAHNVIRQSPVSAGETLIRLSRALGHKRLSTTQVYLQPTKDDVDAMIRAIPFL